MKKIRLFDTFAGYGGAHFGLKKAGLPHESIGFSEIDEFADKIYRLNHPNVENFGDITKIDEKLLPDFDLFTGGFPCQPFSMAGKNLGELDTRGTLFNDIIRICEHKQPRNILLENVKSITFKQHKDTFKKIISELNRIGYNVEFEILNSKDYGIPQNRERVWIFATKNEIPFGWKLAPTTKKLKGYFKEFLDKKVEAHHYLNEKQIEHLINKHKVDFNVLEASCLDIYNKKVRTDGISITLTEPHHNTLRVVEVPKNGKYVVRKLTEFEHFRLMGFEDGEIDLGDLSYSQLCKRAGNGWDVNVASLLFQRIYELEGLVPPATIKQTSRVHAHA
jgi:DNA (cytosine-5)-methyltransferase 1